MTNKNLNNLLDKLACHVGDNELNCVVKIQGVCLVPGEVFDVDRIKKYSSFRVSTRLNLLPKNQKK